MSGTRPDYIACIARTYKGANHASWCTRPVDGWRFVDVTHAAENGLGGGRMVACLDCFARSWLPSDTAAHPMSDLTQQLRERVSLRLGGVLGGALLGVLDATMEDVALWHEVQATKRERAAYDLGWDYRHNQTIDSAVYNGARADAAYPWPRRTREVLREEPVPGCVSPVFRVRDGVLELQRDNGEWKRHDPLGHDFALMRHALDLHEHPTRTESVPVDENNPWGD